MPVGPVGMYSIMGEQEVYFARDANEPRPNYLGITATSMLEKATQHTGDERQT